MKSSDAPAASSKAVKTTVCCQICHLLPLVGAGISLVGLVLTHTEHEIDAFGILTFNILFTHYFFFQCSPVSTSLARLLCGFLICAFCVLQWIVSHRMGRDMLPIKYTYIMMSQRVATASKRRCKVITCYGFVSCCTLRLVVVCVCFAIIVEAISLYAFGSLFDHSGISFLSAMNCVMCNSWIDDIVDARSFVRFSQLYLLGTLGEIFWALLFARVMKAKPHIHIVYGMMWTTYRYDFPSPPPKCNWYLLLNF